MKAAITMKIAAREEAIMLKSEAEKMRFDAAETLHKAIQMLKETEEKQLSLRLSLSQVELCEFATQVRINSSTHDLGCLPTIYLRVCMHMHIHIYIQFFWNPVVFGPGFWVSHSVVM